MPNDTFDPPDEWDADEPPGSSVDNRADALRVAWIEAVRMHHEKATGRPSKYNSHKRWDGGYDRQSNRSYNAVWPRIIRDADEQGLDPVHLLDVLFSSLTTGSAPLPTQIMSAENIARARYRHQRAAADVQSAAANESVVFRSALWSARKVYADVSPDPHVADREAIRRVLNDLGRDMSPLFRFSMATMTGNTDIAARWRPAALAQFLMRPNDYLASWSHLLPQALIQYSAEHQLEAR